MERSDYIDARLLVMTHKLLNQLFDNNIVVVSHSEEEGGASFTVFNLRGWNYQILKTLFLSLNKFSKIFYYHLIKTKILGRFCFRYPPCRASPLIAFLTIRIWKVVVVFYGCEMYYYVVYVKNVQCIATNFLSSAYLSEICYCYLAEIDHIIYRG